ncbi:hypothetical protein CXF83_04565 [Shewanella sp. Choline-02u-19]|uniref:hypothetical protein n=1 Tax=unclassified Shewanella TaxID=196818 RepID=UPI000C33B7B9|nr:MULTISPECIES: hypothetical protein [unclassified Shewanella]PKH55607.1 hypothetical protein CXF84_17510 [Shewanella sp. Bg11-22]PKI29919.1 hypothetical protein CXF83_04565 [Shewanella sp. Choline-02u-19]
MTKLINLFKTSILGGFLVVFPLLLLYLMADELIDLLIGLSDPLVQLLPNSSMRSDVDPFVLALLALGLTSFIFGLFLRSTFMTNLFTCIERNTIGRLTLYRSIKQIAKGIFRDNSSTEAHGQNDSGFRAALLCNNDGSQQFAYLIEQDDRYSTVLIPYAPAGFTGPVKIVKNEKIVVIENSIGDVSAVLSQWGNGALALTAKHTR